MFLIIYIINNIIRVLCALCMFWSFSNGYYIIASFAFIGAMKRDWLIYDPMGYGYKVQIGVDTNHKGKKG